MIDVGKLKLAVLGLGYVGLPLAIEFAKVRRVIGFDIDRKRIDELGLGLDSTSEVDSADFDAAVFLELTSDANKLGSANCYIVTVPTPIDDYKRPDLSCLSQACKTVAKVLKCGDLVIFESTVYPGCTEEFCVPILQNDSGLRFNTDFFCGYSPERVNPGDKAHRISTIKKVTSGSTPDAANAVDKLYREIIKAGTHKTPSIKIAEAAKVIENTQRDLNIALINELAMIFKLLDIDTEAVLDAAETKWNFIPFRPGLVGGHCIGVDPYYLTYKAGSLGYHPEIILAGRRLNDRMGIYVASQLLKAMSQQAIVIEGSRILVMGLTFKENCPDLRNTRVIDIISELNDYRCLVDVYDPWVDPEDAKNKYGLTMVEHLIRGTYDAIILAVGHDAFRAMGPTAIRSLGKSSHVLFDLKYLLPKNTTDLRL